MKTTMTHTGALTAIVAMGCLLLTTACTDDNYDLGNIDKTIAIGSDEGFALPGNNSTRTIALSDLLDIDGNEYIFVNELGDYYFQQSAEEGSSMAAHPIVDEIELVEQESSENDFRYEIEDIATDVSGARAVLRKAGAAPDLSAGAKEIYNFAFSQSETPAVLGLSLAKLRSGVTLEFKFSDMLKQQVEFIDRMLIKLPTFMNIEATSSLNEEAFWLDKVKNTIVISFHEIKNLAAFKQNGIIRMYVKLNEMEPGEDVVKVNGQEYPYHFYFAENNVDMRGGIWLDVVYTIPTLARVEQQNDKELFIDCHSKMDEVVLTGATGNFNPVVDLDNLGDVKINRKSLPDFLQDDEVHLKVHNPQLKLTISNDMDLRGIVSKGVIKARDAAGKLQAVVQVKEFEIKEHKTRDSDGNLINEDESTMTEIIISDEKPEVMEGNAEWVGTEHGTYIDEESNETMELGELSDIIADIPASVTFSCEVTADENVEGNIELGHEYNIVPDFEIYAPLAFDNSSVIVYRDTISGWHDDLDDITLSEGATVTLTADVANKLPLALNMYVDAIELNGSNQWKVMDEKYLVTSVTDVNGNANPKIAAAKENGEESITKVVITLKQNNTEAFKRIDGITYRASAFSDTDSGVVLNDGKSGTQTLQLRNIGINLRGKVIIDLDK